MSEQASENVATTEAFLETRPVKRGRWNTTYVQCLLGALPVALKLLTCINKRVRTEHDHLPQDFVFALDVRGFGRGAVLKRTAKSWKALPKTTKDEDLDYRIEFLDLDYAYAVFARKISLKQALAGRLFASHGPNEAGVALTYLFSAILNTPSERRKPRRG